jgi:uncharacterized protein YxeA
MSAPTTGWVAVGFGATFAMKNAYMVIAYIDEQGKVQVSEEYGTGAWSHSSIKSMGGQSQISQVTGSYDKNTNTTTISFEMPLASKDKKYGKVLTKGKEVTIIMAYGKDGAKNFTNHHQFRASKTIKNFSI